MSSFDGVKRLWILGLFGSVFAAPPAHADAVSDFYSNNQVTIYVGFGAGGGFDLYGRLVAAHLGKHIPGGPNVIVKNMPGGSSRKAAAFVANATPQNGAALGMFLDTLTLSTLVRPAPKFSVEKFVWIGRVTPATKLGYVWHTAPIKSVKDAIGSEVITISATSPTSTSSMIPLALNRVLGTNFKPVVGYKGSAAGALAAERGETHGVGAIGLEVLTSRHASWLRDHKIYLLYVASVERTRNFPDLPALPDFAKNADDRRLLTALGSGTEIGRALAGEPGIPRERAAALRRGFMEMVEDPAFLADAKRRKATVEPLSGEAVQKIVAEVAATPKPVVDILKSLVQKR